MPLLEVLADWTRSLVDGLDAVHLFDLPSGASIYRVFLLPGCLQVDLSFTPAAEFGARGRGSGCSSALCVDKPHAPPAAVEELFGYAVHHALRARFSIERGRCWQAEYWINSVRDYALGLACRARDLPDREGRGFDDLPADLLSSFADTRVSALERDRLLAPRLRRRRTAARSR